MNEEQQMLNEFLQPLRESNAAISGRDKTLNINVRVQDLKLNGTFQYENEDGVTSITFKDVVTLQQFIEQIEQSVSIDNAGKYHIVAMAIGALFPNFAEVETARLMEIIDNESKKISNN